MITELLNGRTLTEDESEALFGRLVRGELSDIEVTALLVALKVQGETPAILAGAARAMRAAAQPFEIDFEVGDSCGTGGDGHHTLNISTAVALVAAECGIPMVKHGNRSVSSRCGSADVLEALGVDVCADPELSKRALRDLDICFLYAPDYHAGLQHAGNVRRALGVRTILNLVGPLANPAAPRYQVVGVYDAAWCMPMAETLGRLGCEGALVVHGSGLDEIALHGPTTGAMLRYGRVTTFNISPSDAELEEFPLERLKGGDVADNAEALRDLLQGRGDEAYRAAVAINTGALLMVSGRVGSLPEGTACALDVLQTDRAWQKLERWKAVLGGAR